MFAEEERMKQKVWFIDDSRWQESPVQGGMDSPVSVKTKMVSQSSALPSTKNPALSFSLSMVVWGSGQMYMGAFRPGSIYLSAMLFFYSTMFAIGFFRDWASRFVAGTHIPAPVFISGAVVFLLAGFSLWLINAVDAYYRTIRLRSEPFRGVDNDLLPLVCALLFPGWGQFLNGQPKKGLFFLLIGGMGISAVIVLSVAPFVWPMLKARPAGPVFELFLVAALVFVPVFLLVWIVSAFDSFRTCRWFGSLPPGYRKRHQGVMKDLFPRATAVLSLLLAISVGNQILPKDYYLNSLKKIRIQALQNNMEKIPELAGKAIKLIEG
jgi:TM2 domain-containing membrane protein YozV